MKRQYDATILIGRFQPFHNGHESLVKKALELGENAIVFLGSSFRPRNNNNPFTWQERAEMLVAGLSQEDKKRIIIIPIRDYYNDERWANAIRGHAETEMNKLGRKQPRIALVGCRKDESSYYLNLFPQWNFEAAELRTNCDATTIREQYYHGDDVNWVDLCKNVPIGTVEFLRQWRDSADYDDMQRDNRAVKTYREKWGIGPFLTVDAVVVVTVKGTSYLLLIRRGKFPGKGLMLSVHTTLIILHRQYSR